jgi:hypothetical protein
MIPFKVLSALFPPSAEGQITISVELFRFLLSAAARTAELDEEIYLRRNPDVALAIREGLWPSGRDHYAATGYFEGRAGSGLAVSETWYLKTNPDVAKAVKEGDWKSAEEHYFRQGMFEWRVPNQDAQEDITAWKHMVSHR